MRLRKDIESKSGKQISLLLFESSKKPKLTVINSHGGLTNSAEGDIQVIIGFIEYCTQNNINFVSVEFSNNGIQPDQPLTELLFSNRIKDLQSTIDFVEAAYNSPIVLLGSSLGGHIVLNAADYSPHTKGVVLNCPAIKAHESIKDLMDKDEFENWERTNKAFVFEDTFEYKFFKDLKNHDASKKIPTLHIPTLIFHGTADKITPIRNSRDAKDHNKNIELIEIKGGSHRFDMGEGKWEEKVKEFVQKIIDNT